MYSDPSGRLNFASKAVVHADGVDFSSGASFKIKMADFELYEELGKGNYGTVQKVWHKPTKVTMALKVRHSLVVIVRFVQLIMFGMRRKSDLNWMIPNSRRL